MSVGIVCVVSKERRKRQWDAISATVTTAHGLSFLSFSFAAAAATAAQATATIAVATTAAATTTPTAAAAAEC